MSSESSALSQSSHRPAGAGTQLGLSDLVCVCVCKSVSQASGAAEPTCVIQVNSAQSITMFTQDQSGQPGLLSCACACSQIQASQTAEPARVIRVFSAQPFTMISHRQSGGRSSSCPSRLGPVTSGNRSREPSSPDFEFQGQCRTADSRDMSPTHSD